MSRLRGKRQASSPLVQCTSGASLSLPQSSNFCALYILCGFININVILFRLIYGVISVLSRLRDFVLDDRING